MSSGLEDLGRIRQSIKQHLREVEEGIEERRDPFALKQRVEEIRLSFLGKKGELTEKLRLIGQVEPALRPTLGSEINNIKEWLNSELERIGLRLRTLEKEAQFSRESLDLTLPGRSHPAGARHPVTQIFEEVENVFLQLGFDVAEGPEVETDHYNFEALNIPKHHPARDLQDTFYLGRELLLRTHTSPVQIHVMKKHRPPLRIIAPGAVYRHDYDVSHSPMFHQVEGLMVDCDVSMAELKGVLDHFAKQIFGYSVKLRFRPHYFPFTEPSAEVDVSCILCNGRGCKVCSKTGWLEIAGCGMVHPAVFESVGYDPDQYTGFAFGFGIERIAMILFGIDDIRLLFGGDLRFLKQFRH
ncbi:MAG: phenylalanine--tRNA ligase subunit alpha [Deltaproteobacteria bacterium]|nr:phenylalanine--tRNA ligase subunit alpha [Deltaproteobacteria bacterium]